MKTLISLLLFAGLGLAQTTTNGGTTVLGPVDFSGATSTKPDKVVTSDPATCSVGETVFRSDTGAIRRCTATNTWSDEGGSTYTLPTATGSVLGGIKIGTGLSIDGNGVVTASGTSVACDPSNIAHACFVEEFATGTSSTGTYGALGWKWSAISSGTTANVTVGSGNTITQHPGLVSIVSTTAANSGGVLAAGNATTTAVVNLADLMAEEWEISWVFKLDSTTDVRVHLGLSEDSTALNPATNNATFQIRYDTDASFNDGAKNTVGSWVAQFCGYGGATTCSDTSGVYAVMNVQPDTNWTRARIYRSGTTIYFQINDVAAKTMCASGCDMTTPSPTSSSADGLAPWVTFGISGTTQRKIWLDRMSFGMTGLTRY